LHMKINNK